MAPLMGQGSYSAMWTAKLECGPVIRCARSAGDASRPLEPIEPGLGVLNSGIVRMIARRTC